MSRKQNKTNETNLPPPSPQQQQKKANPEQYRRFDTTRECYKHCTVISSSWLSFYKHFFIEENKTF